MKRIIKESDLRKIIKNAVTEALKYDKSARQYFPDYTGDPHSDAGKFVSNNRDDFNYARNDYQWSNKDAQRRFQDKQWQNDLEIDPTDPDRDSEGDAEQYLDSHNPDRIVNKASEDMKGDFDAMLRQFCDKAAQKYPVLKNNYYMSDFLGNFRDALYDFDY